MSPYQHALRKELADYRAELEKWTEADLAKATYLSRSLLEKYEKQPEESERGNYLFYKELHEINKIHFHRHITSKLNNKTKFLNLFKSRPEVEKDFASLQSTLERLANSSLVLTESYWREDYLLSVVTNQFNIAKGNPKTYLHGMDNSINHGMRLCLYSHRLMREKAFSREEFPHLHGLPFELSAYKLKRDIEKFASRFSSQLSREQTHNLKECVYAISGFLSIQEKMILNKFLSLNNMSEKGNANNQIYQLRYADIRFDVHHTLNQLKPGMRLLLPHGYRTIDKTGHAALVEFERLKNGTFKISFINTGSGIANQKRGFWNDLKLNMLGILNISYVDNVSMETIINKNLIKTILDPLAYPAATQQDGIDAMNAAIHCFGDDVKQTDHAINIQMNGTCAFSCWIEWLGWHLDPGLFKALDLFINERALHKLQNFYLDTTVPLHLKRGLPALDEAGVALIQQNRKDLSHWLHDNHEHENIQGLTRIAKLMKVEPKKKLTPHEETMQMLDDMFGADKDERETNQANAGVATQGMFGRVVVGAAVAAFAAAAIYSRLA